MSMPSDCTISRLVAPARIIMPSRVRVITSYIAQREREAHAGDEQAIDRVGQQCRSAGSTPASSGRHLHAVHVVADQRMLRSSSNTRIRP